MIGRASYTLKGDGFDPQLGVYRRQPTTAMFSFSLFFSLSHQWKTCPQVRIGKKYLLSTFWVPYAKLPKCRGSHWLHILCCSSHGEVWVSGIPLLFESGLPLWPVWPGECTHSDCVTLKLGPERCAGSAYATWNAPSWSPIT